ncbi:hypothetical protein [uncultured Brevundimonas sp.]|uniref:hypothetical protein n=1 Tax=uncultured Brevundimonas sp. TaxID=213418 RepID=UPI0025CC3AC6|nr:hypothetical protein [uncultured Brevundimonas sp.]
MEWLHTPVQIGLTLAMLVCLTLALWKGGRAQRLAAVGMVLGSVLSALVQDRTRPEAAQWIIMAVDAGYLTLLVGLVWRTPQGWLVWAAALQLAQVISHVSFALNPEIFGRSYIITSYVLFAGLLAALFCGLGETGGRNREAGLRDR